MAFWVHGRRSGESLPDANDNETAQSRRSSAARRPGKFTQVAKFMKIEEDEEPLLQHYTDVMTASVSPGSIVHVRDEGSRLDQRVMLVLRKSEMGYVCLTFCLHPHSTGSEQHWRVCEEGMANMPGEDYSLKALEVILQPDGESSPKVSPQQGVFINTEEIWNVEYCVPVKILGKVVPSILQELAKEVKDNFSKNLDRAIPPAAQPSESEKPLERKTSRRDSKNEPRPPRRYIFT